MHNKTPIRFGTDGWRAVIADEFTFENLGRLARRTAGMLGNSGSVCVGYDNRFLSPEYASFFAAVLEREGITADLSASPVPTPCVSHRVKSRGHSLGICISASHNPYCYNGIKIKESYGGSAGSGLVKKLTDNINSTAYDGPGWGLKYEGQPSSWTEEYLDVFRGVLPSGCLKVAVDYYHGSGYPYFDDVLREKGYGALALRSGREPLFGGISPEPRPSSLTELIAAVNDGGADIGFAFDGDADRIAVIDEKGRYLSMQVILSVLAWDLLEQGRKGKIIKTVAGTCIVERLADEYGAECRTVPIGFKNICPEMIAGDVIIAGEESGGIGFGDYLPERDALYTAARILEMMSRRGRLLGELWDSLALRYGQSSYLREDYGLHNGSSKEELLQKVLKNIKLRKLPHTVESILDIDGIRINMDEGRWLLVRPSGTEPLVRVYAESGSEENTRRLLETGKELTE